MYHIKFDGKMQPAFVQLRQITIGGKVLFENNGTENLVNLLHGDLTGVSDLVEDPEEYH